MSYPRQPGERDRWILARRTARSQLDPWKPYAFFQEQECSETGEIVPVATIFLTNRECPWRCLMCDLWKNTLAETVPLRAIPAQIDYALQQLVAADVSPRKFPLTQEHEHKSAHFTRALTSAATWHIKLYNAGSFFDPRAIPPQDYAAIAELVTPFERVIVECHPALVGESALRFCDLLEAEATRRARLSAAPLEPEHPLTPSLSPTGGENSPKNSRIELLNPTPPLPSLSSPSEGEQRVAAGRERSGFGEVRGEGARRAGGGAPGLMAPMCDSGIVAAPSKLEVALGVETVHPEVLSKLNKRMTLEQFARAAEFLRRHRIALRVFILVRPPFLDEPEALHWAQRSLDFAFDCGAGVAVLIPVRGGNGALEALAEHGEFSPPRLATLEAALDYGIGLRRGRVFADTWDLERLAECPACFSARAERLQAINASQQLLPRIPCERCGGVVR